MLKTQHWFVVVGITLIIIGVAGAGTYDQLKTTIIDEKGAVQVIAGNVSPDVTAQKYIQTHSDDDNGYQANTESAPDIENDFGDKSSQLFISPELKEKIQMAEEARKRTPSLPPSAEPGTILQGGDTFEDAVVITSLPFTDNGTTEGYAHDYDLSCSWGATAPDVIYQYTPTTDDTICVSLMLSEFDTILGIYQDDSNQEIACNDQYCYNSQSYIGHLPLLSGHTYYIVVTGASDYSGNYTLEVFDPPDLAENDNCIDITPQPLNAGTPLTFTGNLMGLESTDDCPVLSYGSGIPQVWIAFTTSEWLNLTIDYCGSNPVWQIVYTTIMNDCCSSFIFADDAIWGGCSDGNIVMQFNYVAPGTYYFPIPDAPNYASGDYVININAASTSACDVECPPGATAEVEPNNGCWEDPYSDFGSITAGETICGDSWVTGDDPRTSDADWYLFTLEENSIVTLTAVADFRCEIGICIPQSADPCDFGSPIFTGAGGPCETITIPALLAGPGPGVYVIIVQPQDNVAFDNGIYWLNMAVEPAPPGPANDRCEDVTPVNLVAGQSVQITGDNTNAIMDCPSNFWGSPEVWEAFTIADTMNIMVDFCGTNPPWSELWGGQPLYLALDCPCSSDWLMAQTWESVSCGDGDWTYGWYGLPPGTYYIPINSSLEYQQPYTMNIDAIQYFTPPSDTLPCTRASYTSDTWWVEYGPGFCGYQAMSSQCDPTGLMNGSVIDDFILSGDGSVTIDTVIFLCDFFPDQHAGPAAWEGIAISIYADNDGMPGGHPLFPDPGCGQAEDIPGGIISAQILQPGQYDMWAGPLGLGYWWIHVPIAPVTLTAGTTYWINIQPIQDYSQYNFSLNILTPQSQGYPALRLSNGEWSDAYGCDPAFCLIGSEFNGYAYLPGDANMINGQWPPTIIGGDVTYLVGYFRGINGPCLVGGFYNAADANGDCLIIGSDVTRLVSYFRGISDIAHCADYPPAWLVPGDCPTEVPAGWPNCEVAR
jgi:hypothetical protein